MRASRVIICADPLLGATVNLASTLGLAIALAATGASAKTVYTDRHDFTGQPDGDTPLAELVADSQGRLYGTTLRGGDFGNGALFRLTLPPTKTGPGSIEILHSFQYSEGAVPKGGVLIAADGGLYGTSNTGGLFNSGTIWRVDPVTFALKKLHDFNPDATPRDGSVPSAGLAAGPNGLLYGTTGVGGPLGYGTVFAISPMGDTQSYATIHAFGAAGDGARPSTGRLVASGNKLYGNTSAGGNFNGFGTAFQMILPKGRTKWTESVLYQFGSVAGDAFMPVNGLTLDKSGQLYGCAPGGQFGQGAVYRLTPTAGGAPWKETILYSFGATAGEPSVVECSVVFNKTGRLVGTSSNGGQFGNGTVFTLTPTTGTWTLAVVHSFGAVAGDATTPTSPLLGVAGGNFVGVTDAGGAGGKGVVYEVKP